MREDIMVDIIDPNKAGPKVKAADEKQHTALNAMQKVANEAGFDEVFIAIGVRPALVGSNITCTFRMASSFSFLGYVARNLVQYIQRVMGAPVMGGRQ